MQATLEIAAQILVRNSDNADEEANPEDRAQAAWDEAQALIEIARAVNPRVL